MRYQDHERNKVRIVYVPHLHLRFNQFQLARGHLFCNCFFVTRDIGLWQKFLFHKSPLFISNLQKMGFKEISSVACFQHPELVMQGYVSSYRRFLLTLGLHSKVRSCGLRGTPVCFSKVSPRSSPQGQGFSRKDFTVEFFEFIVNSLLRFQSVLTITFCKFILKKYSSFETCLFFVVPILYF